MPPIPTKFDDDIQYALNGLQHRHRHLEHVQIPALHNATKSLSEQQAVAAELKEDLDDFGRRIEALEQLVEDLELEKTRVEGRVLLQEWADKYALLKKEGRLALLSSKKLIDQNAKSRRDELLGSKVLTEKKYDNEKTDDTLMRTTSSLTEALHRTEARLRSELERSVLSTQLLQQSTASLRQSSTAYGTLSGLLDTSKGLIKALERTDWMDRMLIMGALALFFAACLWIIKVRIVDRALWLAFWWTRFMPDWRGEESIIDELEKGLRTTVVEIGTAVVETLVEGVPTVIDAASSLQSIIGTESTSEILQTATVVSDDITNTLTVAITTATLLVRDEL